MSERRSYDASRPLYVAWSLESPIFSTCILVQLVGNETHIVGSRDWKLAALHSCLADFDKTWRWPVRAHIVPPDPDQVYRSQFDTFGWYAEQAPDIKDNVTLTRQLFATTVIDTAPRPWTGGAENNLALVEALKSFSPRPDQASGGFIVTPQHTLERWYARAVELFAAWRYLAGDLKPARPFNYRNWDRAVI